MKKLMRIVMVLVLILLVGVGGLYFYRNSLIRSAVESQAGKSLKVKTTLGSANLAVFGGNLSLGDLKIGSPPGYAAEQMLVLGELNLGVDYGALKSNPVRVRRLSFDKPKIVIEHANGKFNFQALMDQLAGPSSPTPTPTPTPSKKDEPAPDATKLIIDQLDINGAEVVIKSAMLPKEITVTIPAISLKNIGNGDGNQNGAAIKDVIGVAMGAVAANASALPDLKQFGDFSKLLNEQAGAMVGQISKELGNQVNQISGQITGELNKAIGGVTGDLNKTIGGVTGGKDPGKAVEDGLKGLLPGNEKKNDKPKSK